MMIKSWWPLVTLLLFVSAPISQLAVEYSEPYDHSQPEKSNNGNRQRSEFAVLIHENGDRPEGKQESGWQSYFDKPTDWLLAIFTGFLVLYTRRPYQATAGLFVETKRLGDAADAQKGDMAKSLDIADKSARAAIKSASIAERAMFDLERPYVFLETVKFWRNAIDPESTTWAFLADYVVSNHGRTPAVIESAKAGTLVTDSLPAFGVPNWVNIDGLSVLGPNAREIKNGFDLAKFSKADQVRIFNEEMYIVFAIEVAYRDIFSNRYVSAFGVRAMPLQNGTLLSTSEGCAIFNFQSISRAAGYRS